MERFVKLAFEKGHSADQRRRIKHSLMKAPGEHFSVLMGYDFHINVEKNILKLIEINTNAAGYLLGENIYTVHGIKNNYLNSLKDSFFNEAYLFGLKNVENISIIDEDPKNQRNYLEFLMFKNFFKHYGIKSDILDVSCIKNNPETKSLIGPNNESLQIIYNRYCDFLFSSEQSKYLLDSYLSGKNLFTPHPKEYLMLSDKQRLVDWSDEDDEIFKTILATTKNVSYFSSSEEIWEKRKNLVFKPKNLYGSKGVFLGKSITRKKMNEVLKEEFLIQEMVSPGKITLENSDWKFDVRAYVYKDKIQQVLARIYKGQVTNFSEKNSGFAAVAWT